MSADHEIVALIVCAAVLYLAKRFSTKKEANCCGKQMNRKRRT